MNEPTLQKIQKTYSINENEIGGTTVGILTAHTVRISNDLHIDGKILGSYELGNLVQFPDGTVNEPGVKFGARLSGLTSDNQKVNIVNNGIVELSVKNNSVIVKSAIETESGNLVLNPVGSSVDFSGKNIINVGSISTDANSYTVKSNVLVGSPGGIIATTLLSPIKSYNLSIIAIGADINANSCVYKTNLRIIGNSLIRSEYNKVINCDSQFNSQIPTLSLNSGSLNVSVGANTGQTRWYVNISVLLVDLI